MSNDNNKSASAPRHFASLLFLPVLFVAFYALRALAGRFAIEQWLPEWDTFVTLGVMMVVERIYTYRCAVSQRSMLVRDIASTLVNVYLTYAVTAMILLPGLLLLTEYAFGRPLMVASPEQLGPIWLQVPVIWLIVSFFRYWMHRWQHSNEFLWKLHSYHHRVTDLKATNTFVSHPIDYALRNVVVYVVLGLVGFAPLALLIALPALAIPGIFSHCGADVKAGALSTLVRDARGAPLASLRRRAGRASVLGQLLRRAQLLGPVVRDVLPAGQGWADGTTRARRPSRRARRRAELHQAGVGAVGTVAVRAVARRFARRQRAS